MSLCRRAKGTNCPRSSATLTVTARPSIEITEAATDARPWMCTSPSASVGKTSTDSTVNA